MEPLQTVLVLRRRLYPLGGMPEQPRVKLVCPECGGPLPPEAATAVVRCERCGHASAPVARAAAPAQPPCPRCKAPLFEGNAHGVKLLGCGICGGIFLDNEGSTRITRAPDAVIAHLAKRAKERAVMTTIDVSPKDLPCPACTAPMRRVLARGFVEIDYCASHGTWFDRGELNRVMDAYSPGPDPAAVDAAERAAAEARMAHLRVDPEREREMDQFRSSVGAPGLSLGLLGVLGALVQLADD